MLHHLRLLLISPLFLCFPAAVQSQETTFHWERTDRTTEGWMNGASSSFNVGLTPDSVALMTTSEGLFRIVERNEDGIIGYVAELINPEVDGYFIGTIGDRIYLKREGGNEVWASSDNGLNWERIIAYAPYNAVEIIGDGSAEGSKIVTYDPDADNLIISAPTGQRLSTRKLPIRQWGLAASPSGVLYIWEINPGMNDQILRSHDLGNTWISVALDGLNDARLYSFLYVGDSVLLARTSEGLAVSYDQAESWIRRSESPGLNAQVARIDLMYALRGATSTENPDSFTLTRSVDTGQTWTECGEAPSLAIRPLPDGSLYAVTDGVMWRTDGCGSAWKRVYGDFRSVSVDTVLAVGNDFLAVVYGVLPGEERTEGGRYLMRSRDDGATWEPIMEDATSILGLTDEGKLYLSIEQSTPVQDTGEAVIEWSRKIMQSSDGGETWRSLPDLDASSRTGLPVGVLHFQGEDYVMMTRKGPGLSSPVYPIDDLLYSSDGGTTFELIDSTRLKGDTDLSYMQAFLLPDGRIYGGPVHTYNESTAFSRFDPRTGIREELPSPVPFTALWLAPSGRLYGWKSERLFRSEDGGESWEELVNPMPERTVRGVSEGAGDILYLGLWNREIYQSTDDGTTWILTRDIDWNVDFNPPLQLPLLDIDPIDTVDGLHIANVFYYTARTLNDGYVRRVNGKTLVYSGNGGRDSWHPAIDDHLRYQDVTSFAINDRGVLVAGTWSGGLYRTVGASGVEEQQSRWPIVIDLR